MRVINTVTAITLVALSLFNHIAIAQEKTIKFHKPETEAEKALDMILRVSEGLMPDCQKGFNSEIFCPNCKEIKNGVLKIQCTDFTNDNITTQAFREDENRQQREYEAKEGCKNDGLCMFSASDHLLCTNGSLTTIGFLYYTKKYQDNIYIYIIPRESKNDTDVVAKKYINHQHNYQMKKENGKWKIDGVCCHGHKINHKQCW